MFKTVLMKFNNMDKGKERLFEVMQKLDETFKTDLNESLYENGITIKSEIEGRSKPSAINHIYKKIIPLTKGFFRDESWENVKKVFDAFGQMGIEWD